MPNANYGYPTTMGTMPQSQSYMPNMMVNTGMVPGNVPMVSHMPVGTMGMSPAPMTKGPVGANVYVNNIRPGVTDQQLFAVFGKYGNIVSTRLFPQVRYIYKIIYILISTSNVQHHRFFITYMPYLALIRPFLSCYF